MLSVYSNPQAKDAIISYFLNIKKLLQNTIYPLHIIRKYVYLRMMNFAKFFAYQMLAVSIWNFSIFLPTNFIVRALQNLTNGERMVLQKFLYKCLTLIIYNILITILIFFTEIRFCYTIIRMLSVTF